MKKSVVLLTSGVIAAVIGCVPVYAEEAGQYFDVTLSAEMSEDDTAAHSMHKGTQALDSCATTCTLTLKEDGSYSLEKVMKSVNDDEINCTYTFEGSYEPGTEDELVLNPAEHCVYEESYGVYDGSSVIGTVNNKSGDETTDPLCLEYFDTYYLAYCGNEATKLKMSLSDNTFEIKDHNDSWEYRWLGDNEVHIVQDIVQQYEQRPLGEIVYYGASNFRLWENMEEDMLPYIVQNHGIGGSVDTELMQFADELLYQFQPKVVFIQTGSNDYTDGATMEEVFANKEKMFAMFQENLPDTKFVIMAGLPLPNRAEYWDLTVEVNNFLDEYCAEHENMYFVDATDVMLTDSGEEDMATGDGRYFNPDIFANDGIHLTQEGHDLWTPFMKDILAELGFES